MIRKKRDQFCNWSPRNSNR